ncbi:MAG: hypothetical protein RLZZ127_3048, partial [Planctomycetota bacterium]
RGDGAWAKGAAAQGGMARIPARRLLAWSVEDTPKLIARKMDGLGTMMENLPWGDVEDTHREAVLAAMPKGEALAATIAGPTTMAAWDDQGVLRLEGESRLVPAPTAP